MLSMIIGIAAALWLGFRIYRARRHFWRYLRWLAGCAGILGGIAAMGMGIIVHNVALYMLACGLLYLGTMALPE